MDVAFHFVCDNCGFRCFLVLHSHGGLDGYKCPKCEKGYDVVHQNTDKTVPDFIGTETLEKPAGLFIGRETLKNISSATPVADKVG